MKATNQSAPIVQVEKNAFTKARQAEKSLLIRQGRFDGISKNTMLMRSGPS